jgi:hypothetical protein
MNHAPTPDRAAMQQALDALESVDGAIVNLLGSLALTPDADAPGHAVRSAIAALRAALAHPAPAYVDSTPHLNVGNSAFESWFQGQPFAIEPGIKQMCRDSYAAGMGDPLVVAAAPAEPAEPVAPVLGIAGCNCRWRRDEQIEWCELHLAHRDAIHEWAARAKAAEKKLAAAQPPQPLQPPAAALLVRDIAPDLGVTPLQVCAALRLLGFGNHSVNMPVTEDMARELGAHFAAQPHGGATAQPVQAPAEQGADPVMTRDELVAAAESIGMRFPATAQPVQPPSAPAEPAESVAACQVASQWGRLYTTANALVAQIGAHGDIASDDDRVASLMDALHDLDGGEWMPGLMPAAAQPPQPVQPPTVKESLTVAQPVQPPATAQPVQAPQPLTAQQLDKLIEAHVGGAELADGEYSAMVMFAAAVERAHGIGARAPQAQGGREP